MRTEKNETTVERLGENICSSSSTGNNEKFLGRRICDGKLGVVKFPIIKSSLDCINEVVAYRLGLLFGIPVCKASREVFDGRACIISEYAVAPDDVNRIVSLRRAVGEADRTKFNAIFNIDWICSHISREAMQDYIRMILLDILMRQTDRHVKNIAFINNKMYPLFDNGRSLFFEEPDMLQEIDVDSTDSVSRTFYLNEHGYGWPWIDAHLPAKERLTLINSHVAYEQIKSVLCDEYKDQNLGQRLARYIFSAYEIIRTW